MEERKKKIEEENPLKYYQNQNNVFNLNNNLLMNHNMFCRHFYSYK